MQFLLILGIIQYAFQAQVVVVLVTVVVVVVVVLEVEDEVVEVVVVEVNLAFRFSISALTSFKVFNSLESQVSTSMKRISPTKLDQLDQLFSIDLRTW